MTQCSRLTWPPHETALFNRWLDGLIAAGVPEADTTNLWIAIATPPILPRLSDRGQPRMDFDERAALVDNMNTRFVRAVDQFHLADLL